MKAGGILYMAIPDKRFTFDHDRPVTTLAHLRRDHEEGPAWSYMMHMYETMNYTCKVFGEKADAEVKKLVESQYSIHMHVWTQSDLLEFLVEARRRYGLPYDIDAVVQSGYESIVILRKRHEPVPNLECPPGRSWPRGWRGCFADHEVRSRFVIDERLRRRGGGFLAPLRSGSMGHPWRRNDAGSEKLSQPGRLPARPGGPCKPLTLESPGGGKGFAGRL